MELQDEGFEGSVTKVWEMTGVADFVILPSTTSAERLELNANL